jgi:hypothetical protein
MGQEIYNLTSGDMSAELATTERGGLTIKLAVQGSKLHPGQSISMELGEPEVRSILAVLAIYIDSREIKFNVGDIVYEPKHYKRAAEVISILGDRIYYGAPYRIRFIDQAEGQPLTDYFAAEQLVLVQRAAD